MTEHGVILYGPPASGKDTVTEALVTLDPAFRHYRRLKAGTGRVAGYEMIEPTALVEMRQRGHVLYENARYGNRYVVDRPRLQRLFASGAIPIVHIGQVAGIRALVSSYPARWVTVMLWCSRETSMERVAAREGSHTDSRIRAWEQTNVDVSENGTDDFALWIDTGQTEPNEAAQVIRAAVLSGEVTNYER